MKRKFDLHFLFRQGGDARGAYQPADNLDAVGPTAWGPALRRYDFTRGNMPSVQEGKK
jgi:hypothetical protein